MKRHMFLLVFIAVFCSHKSNAQQWLDLLPEKPKSELTFYDYQNAFNSFWAPYNVVNGYYFVDGVRTKAIGWKQFKRWEYAMKSLINPETGLLPEKSIAQVLEEYNQDNPQPKSLTESNWVNLGTNSSNGGYSGIGRVNCVSFHPSNNSIYWVGTAGGGVWKTTNGGTSWTALTDQIGTLAISDIAIPSDYATSNTIYIATGDRDQSWATGSAGVLKSTDGGATWNATGITYSLSAFESVNKLLISPTDNQLILAATSNGLYKTTNGGTTWSQQLTNIEFVDIEHKPGDFNTMYGSTRTGRIYLSTNAGTTWTQVFTNSGAGRIELGVSANQSSWVYAVVSASNESLLGIYKSTNSGSTYSQVFAGSSSNLLGYSSSGNDASGQSSYDLTIAVSPSNANTVIVGGVNTWRSTNGGTSWSIVNHWTGSGAQAVHADKHCHKYRSNGDLFEGNDGGIYFSSNNGTNWTDKTNGMVISQIYRLGVSKTNASETVTGLQDNGSKLLASANWSDVTGGDGMECIISHSNINTQYTTYVNGEIYRTTNHWGNYSTINPSSAGSGAWVTPYVMDPTNAQILYAGYSNVWKSTNGGTSWTQISSINSSYLLESMAIAPSNTQVLYVADGYTMWKTTNGGGNWTTVTSGLPINTGNITYIAVKNDDPNTVWVTIGGFGSHRVYQSTNGGSSWSSISTGLPAVPVYTIVQDVQSTSELHLFVGTETGVYYKNGTANWVPYNTNLPNVRVKELEIYYATDPANSRLRAATFGRGLWESPIYISSPTTPVAGTVSANMTICSGQTATLTLAGNNGTIQWQQSSDNSTWTNVTGGVGATTASYTTTSLSQATYFRVAVTLNATTVYSNSVLVSISSALNLPLAEGFQGAFAPSGWTVYNPDADAYTWELATTGNGSTQGARVNNYDNAQVGAIDELILPSYSFIGATSPVMTFDLSYARYDATYFDSLKVYASSDCGVTWQVVYQKGNTGLATVADYAAGVFVPSSANQWRTETVNLSSFAGQTNVLIKFRNISGYGQGLYIDNINIQNQVTVTPSITITSNDTDNSICSGSSITFTATPTNGGSSPTYQWKVNGVNVGTNSATYTTSTLTNGQVVTCTITSSMPGASTTPVASTGITISVTSSVTPTATISVSSMTICTGSSAVFTAVPTNEGTTPSYQWKVNGVNVGTNSTTYSSTSLTNNAVVTCVLTSNATCASPSSVTSNSITMTVSNSVTPLVSVTSDDSDNSVCNGTAVTFTAVPTNGGTTPTYQWLISGIASGSGTVFTTSGLANGASVVCTMTSSLTCATTPSASSTPITMTVLPSVTPTAIVAITTGSNPVCEGENVQFSVTPTNGGNSPSYQWKINGVNAGTNASVFSTSILANNDMVTCVLTSNQACASPSSVTSQPIAMQVNPVPSTPLITINGTVLSSSATSGNQWYLDGVAIIGATSQTYTMQENGNYSVVVTNNGCSSSSSALFSMTNLGITDFEENTMFVIAPNPSDGKMTIQFNSKTGEKISVLCRNLAGQLVYIEDNILINDELVKELDFTNFAKGQYIISLYQGNKRNDQKIVIN